jgi:hypothetical protein
VIDIGPETLKEINSIHQGHLFLLGETSIKRNEAILSNSLTTIVKDIFKKQEQKR